MSFDPGWLCLVIRVRFGGPLGTLRVICPFRYATFIYTQGCCLSCLCLFRLQRKVGSPGGPLHSALGQYKRLMRTQPPLPKSKRPQNQFTNPISLKHPKKLLFLEPLRKDQLEIEMPFYALKCPTFHHRASAFGAPPRTPLGGSERPPDPQLYFGWGTGWGFFSDFWL